MPTDASSHGNMLRQIPGSSVAEGAEVRSMSFSTAQCCRHAQPLVVNTGHPFRSSLTGCI